MKLEEIIQIAAQSFQQNNANTQGLDPGDITAALSQLLGGQANGSGIDLSSLVNSLNNGGLADLAASWLGDGDNAPLGADQLSNMFPNQNLQDFASRLGLDEQSANDALSQVLPTIVDKASSGGSLMESSGGLSGLIDAAKDLLTKR